MINYYNQDCMDFMANKPNDHYDLLIADPPYFSGPEKRQYYGKPLMKKNIKRPKYHKIKKWEKPSTEWLYQAKRVSKNQIIWGINYFENFTVGHGRIIWDKVNETNSFSDCEIAFCSLHESVRLFRYLWNGMMQGKSINEGHIQQGNKQKNEKRIHQTQKPVILYKWLLKKYAKPGYKILDTHLGSGSIGIACHDYDCHLDATELDPEIYWLAQNRLNQHQSNYKIEYNYAD